MKLTLRDKKWAKLCSSKFLVRDNKSKDLYNYSLINMVILSVSNYLMCLQYGHHPAGQNKLYNVQSCTDNLTKHLFEYCFQI